MPRKKKDVLAFSTGVTMELPVRDFLDALVENGMGKDRSAVFNFVVREYARRIKKTPIPSAKILSVQPELKIAKG